MTETNSSFNALNEFVSKHIKPVLIQELDNRDSIHLYSIGDYWMAFDKSAYALYLLMDDGESPTLLTLRDYPFPVMMKSIHYEVADKLLFTQVVAKWTLDYRRLVTKPIDRDAYRKWCDEYLEEFVGADGEDGLL